MKKVIFKKLLLLSEIERKARTIQFHSRLTIITSQDDVERNTVGKSCVVKSLYYTLGADIVFAPGWKPLNVKTAVEFSLDGKFYTAVRDGIRVAIFDEMGEMLINTTHLTSELGPFLHNLYQFPVRLAPSKISENTPNIIYPTPVFAYLPFYVDQDGGLVQYWNSFNNLKQFKDGKKLVFQYYLGFKPKILRYISINASLK